MSGNQNMLNVRNNLRKSFTYHVAAQILYLYYTYIYLPLSWLITPTLLSYLTATLSKSFIFLCDNADDDAAITVASGKTVSCIVIWQLGNDPKTIQPTTSPQRTVYLLQGSHTRLMVDLLEHKLKTKKRPFENKLM